jgi:hypothetical protein
MSLYSFIMEMATWFTPNLDLITKAKRADKNGLKQEDKNYLTTLQNKWTNGYYDEDPIYLVNELKSIANKY